MVHARSSMRSSPPHSASSEGESTRDATLRSAGRKCSQSMPIATSPVAAQSMAVSAQWDIDMDMSPVESAAPDGMSPLSKYMYGAPVDSWPSAACGPNAASKRRSTAMRSASRRSWRRGTASTGVLHTVIVPASMRLIPVSACMSECLVLQSGFI